MRVSVSFCLFVVLCVLEVKGQANILTLNKSSIFDNPCEEVLPSGEVKYYACIGVATVLLAEENANYTVTVEPETATCGTPSAYYCTLGLQECDFCAATDPDLAHPPDNMLDRVGDGSADLSTWWQGITWFEHGLNEPDFPVTITVSLDHAYELQDNIIITFKSGFPRRMILEKSADFGVTWQPWQYYSSDCLDDFPDTLMSVPREAPDTVFCSERFSKPYPYSMGQLLFDVIEDRFVLYLGEFYTDYERLYNGFNETDLNRFLTFTDFRFRLELPATDGNENLRKREDFIKYFYAIADLQLTGSCSCNLHAKYCTEDAVSGNTVCACAHNTEGDNCERCQPLYNNIPWKPGFYAPFPKGVANQCEKCECHEHAESCAYDPAENMGICQDCQHNTTGVNCHRCLEDFFPNATATLEDPDICLACDCEPMGAVDGDLTCDRPDGTCHCKPFTTGRRCDECQGAYYGLLQQNNPGSCKSCNCNPYGSVNTGTSVISCEQADGQCPCKENVEGRDCSRCKDGFFSFPNGRPLGDCIDCECDPGGSVTMICDKTTGQCPCQPAVSLQHCNQTIEGYYSPDLDYLSYQPNGGTCAMDTDIIHQENPFTGRVFYVCQEGEQVDFEEVGGDQLQEHVLWSFRPTLRYSLNSTEPWELVILTYTITGDSGIDLTTYRSRQPDLDIPNECNPNIALPGSETIRIDNLSPGMGQAMMLPMAVTLDARCTYSLSLTSTTQGLAQSPLVVDSLILLPDRNDSVVYNMADLESQLYYEDCERRLAALSTESEAREEYICKRFTFATTTQMTQTALMCGCDPVGTVPGTQCERFGGQCRCKPGVYGRRCDVCEPGYFNMTQDGCEPCDCDFQGSLKLVCDYVTGQCPCQPNVALAGDANVLDLDYDLHCGACIPDYYGLDDGDGCLPCECDDRGSNQTQCDITSGVCGCKATIAGDKCDVCEEGFFLYTPNGCSPCDCDVAGSETISCDQMLGDCSCKANVQGEKCDSCADDSFNMAASNSEGCQRCFCFGHSTTCSSAAGYSTLYLTDDNAHSYPLEDPLGTGTLTHVTLPERFHGNRISSYAQRLSFLAQTRGGVEIDFTDMPAVMLEGNGERIIFNSSGLMARTEATNVEVFINEQNFYYNQTDSPNYFRFYALLANLTGIYIQRRFGENLVDVSNITLTTTQPLKSDQPETGSVELCECEADRNVDGQSCEICSQGSRRPTPLSTVFEPCEACDCNQRAETDPPICDEASGVCLNCLNGTVGDDCGMCAEFVANCDVCTAEQCGECFEGYWGMNKDGCQPCECDDVGAVDFICDAVDGQCQCLENVGGRRCDQCADNFFDLRPNVGCQECDSCYALVNNDVTILREMRDNLTRLVDELVNNDVTTELGPFSARLHQTQTDMQWLLLYLSEADRVQGSTRTEITRLNSTLVRLSDTLTIDADTAITTAIDNITTSLTYTTVSRDVINETNSAVMSANELLNGEQVSYRLTIEDLLSSIRTVQSIMEDVSDSAIGDVIRVSGVVERIVSESAGTKDIADEAYLAAQEAQNVHRRTTSALNQLESFLTMVTNLQNQTRTLAGYALGNATLSLDQANVALNNATEMESIPIDVNALVNRATLLKSEAETLTVQANTAMADSHEVTGRVSDARLTTDALVSQVEMVEATSSQLAERMRLAQQQAMSGSELEDQSYSEARRMLDIMLDFRAQAGAVQIQANRSLETVQEIQELAEQAMVEGIALQRDLQQPGVDSQVALDTANTARQISIDNIQEYGPVQEQSDELYNFSSSVLVDVESYPAIINDINSSIVIPADQTCTLLTNQRVQVQEKSLRALDTATMATEEVADTTGRVNSVLQEIQNSDTIDTDHLESLRLALQTTKTNFDKPLLVSSLTRLKSEMEDNRIRIESMKERRDQLQGQIRRLRLIQEQLGPT